MLISSFDWHCAFFRLNADEAKPVKDPEILAVNELKEGQLIRGYITCVKKCGIFIRSDILLELFKSSF